MKVEVVRSPRRRKTVQARMVGGVLRLWIPANMSAAEEQHWISEMSRRLERQSAAGEIDLEERARKLAHRYLLPVPSSIRWVDNQNSRWGSCTPRDGTIRISSRLAREPGWVLDCVIVHELAHLVVYGHTAEFWALVGRYPLAERARGFLIARGLEDPDGGECGDHDGEAGPDTEPAPAADHRPVPGRAHGGTRPRPARPARPAQAHSPASPGQIGPGQIGLFEPDELAG